MKNKYILKGKFLDTLNMGKKQLQEIGNEASELRADYEPKIETDNFLLTVDDSYGYGGKTYLILAHFYENKMRLKFYQYGEKKLEALFVAK